MRSIKRFFTRLGTLILILAITLVVSTTAIAIFLIQAVSNSQ